MLDAAIEKSVKDLNAVTENRPSCPAKTLPYYWTMVVVRYSPELNETQIRLHVNSDLTGKKDFALTKAFKVYLAASQPHAMPTKDGDREFSFEVFASGDVSFGASGQASVVYDQDTLSSTAHRASASVTTPIEVIINSRSVKRWRAAGRFPFTKSFWDDVRSRDVSQTVSQQGDLNPIAIKGDARVAYRMEVGTSPTAFVSGSATFTMPPPLTFALLGDSYSAGQGAPILSKLEGPWLDDDCHRSRSSGQYIAVNQFIKASNKACDYLFKACEGAVIQDVIDQAQRTKHEPDGTTHGDLKQSKAQVDLVRDWMTEKGYSHLNVALFGIGGNNSGFEPAIEAAIIGWEPFGEYGWKDGTDNQKLRSQVDAGFAYINGANGYKRIDTVMRDRLKVGDIIIFGYPDVTHNSDGTICKTDCSDPPEGSTSTNIVPHSISAEELGYGDTVMSRLTAAVGLAGKLPGWHYVDIFHATKNRGICACQNICLTTWTVATTPGPVNFACVRGKGAMINGASCSFHPNGRGYQLYVAPILAQLVSLYGN